MVFQILTYLKKKTSYHSRYWHSYQSSIKIYCQKHTEIFNLHIHMRDEKMKRLEFPLFHYYNQYLKGQEWLIFV